MPCGVKSFRSEFRTLSYILNENFFAQIVNSFMLLTIFVKNFFKDFWLASEYTSMLLRKNRNKNTVDEVNPFFLSENLSYKISKKKKIKKWKSENSKWTWQEKLQRTRELLRFFIKKMKKNYYNNGGEKKPYRIIGSFGIKCKQCFLANLVVMKILN